MMHLWGSMDCVGLIWAGSGNLHRLRSARLALLRSRVTRVPEERTWQNQQWSSQSRPGFKRDEEHCQHHQEETILSSDPERAPR
jgi:hypothetical protein